MSPRLNLHPRRALAALGAALVLLTASPPASALAAAPPRAPAAPAASTQSAPALLPELSALVTRQRKIIVLMDGHQALDEVTRERATLVGRILSTENHEAQEALAERLSGELSQAVARGQEPASVRALLEALERPAPWRDADKLALRGLVTELADGLRGREDGAGRALLARMDEDLRGLERIRALYEKELDQTFGQLETRGVTVRREKWSAYVAFARGLFSREEILKAYEAELSALDAGRRGGGQRRKVDPLLIDGLKLPPMTVVLTFDDGPHGKHTGAILDVLEKYEVKSIFFAVGKNVATPGPSDTVKERATAALARRVLEEGHLLANHSYSHAFLPKLDADALSRELDDSKRMLETAGHTKITLFRPPYGARSESVDTALTTRGLKAYLWSADSLDWSDPVPKSIADRVIREVEAAKRGVILLHDIHKQSVESLPLMIETLQKRGYRFVLWDGENILGGDTKLAARGGEVSTPRSGKPLYRDSHAVVVGINEYKSWPKLSYAVNDAQAIRDVLVNKFLFNPRNVHLLLNGEATRDRILSVLGDSLADTAKVDKDDRVFFFFAGHGVTRKLPNGGAQGYIVPVEADTKNFQAQAISMTSFQDVSEAIPAKHIFYVMDACYSGLALTRGANAAPGPDVRKYLEEITRRATRQVLTAGGSDEQVSDRGPNGHSIFTWTLLQGLEGRADANADGYVTATELASYVAPAVSSLSQQTPAFGSMVGSEGGEFVLELNHEGEFLSDVSGQLDQEAVQLNTELERIRKLIAEKEARNKKLAGEVALASAQLASLEPGRGATTAEAPSPQDQARRENDRGMALYREKKYAEALAAFERAAQLDPQDAQAANNVGFILFKLERVREALPWLEKTVALSPNRAPAYVNLGDTYDKLGRKADALGAYRRYLELMPTSPLGERVKKRMTELQ